MTTTTRVELIIRLKTTGAESGDVIWSRTNLKEAKAWVDKFNALLATPESKRTDEQIREVGSAWDLDLIESAWLVDYETGSIVYEG